MVRPLEEGPATLPVSAIDALPARSMLTRWEAVDVEVMGTVILRGGGTAATGPRDRYPRLDFGHAP